MTTRVTRILSLWFVLQIVLPFTAPLQTCDIRDLLGAPVRHHGPASPESSSTPTSSEADSEAYSFTSPLAGGTLRVSTALAVTDRSAADGPFVPAFLLATSPGVQQTVLRL